MSVFSLLLVSFTTFSCLFPIFSRTSLLSLLLIFPSELLLEAEEVVEVESLEFLLERELVLVTLELTECLLASPLLPRLSWREH